MSSNQGAGARKNVLFYSMQCQHSRSLINFIKANVPQIISNGILFVCIDNPQVEIPPFIRSVPTLYLPVQKAVLTENDIYTWFKNIIVSYNSQMQQQIPRQGATQNYNNGNMNGGGMNGGTNDLLLSNNEITGDPTITAYLTNEMSGHANVNYSYIDDNEGLAKNFFYYDCDNDKDKGLKDILAFTKPDQNQSITKNQSELKETINIRQGPPPPKGGEPMNMQQGYRQQNTQQAQSLAYANNNQQQMQMPGPGSSLPSQKVGKPSKGDSAKMMYERMMNDRASDMKQFGAPRF